MAFTWDEDDISTDLARVRDAIGDTDSSDPILSDARINALLTTYGSWRVAAAHACDRVAAHFARVPTSQSRLGLSSGQAIMQHFRDLKAGLLRESAQSQCEVDLTGSSIADKEVLTDDTDRIQPWSSRGKFDNNG